jgi:hypothetical protein
MPAKSPHGEIVGFEEDGQADDFIGSACWTRTNDPLINSQLLYQLS